MKKHPRIDIERTKKIQRILSGINPNKIETLCNKAFSQGDAIWEKYSTAQKVSDNECKAYRRELDGLLNTISLSSTALTIWRLAHEGTPTMNRDLDMAISKKAEQLKKYLRFIENTKMGIKPKN